MPAAARRFAGDHRQAGDAIILTVAYDEGDVSNLASYLRSSHATWPAVNDGQAVVDYGVSGIPESYLVDPAGTVVAKYVGGVVAAQLNAFIAEASDERRMSQAAGRGPADRGAPGCDGAPGCSSGWWRWWSWPSEPTATAAIRPSQQQTMHIAGLVRCPVCEGQSAAQSDAPASVQIRAQIQRELVAGEHQGQILVRPGGRLRAGHPRAA